MKGKAPIYVGVFVENEEESNQRISVYTVECLKEIYSKYPEPQILSDIESFDKVFSRPKDAPHITTLFIGKTKIDQLPQKHAVIYE